MPDGKTHIKALKTSNIPVLLMWGIMMSVGWWLGFMTLEHIAFSSAGFLFGYLILSRYVDPDADLLGMTEAEGRAMREAKVTRNIVVREAGGCIGFLFVWWMFPYAYIMKYFGGHRGLSHVLIIGTLTRFAWIAVPVSVVWYALGFPFPVEAYLVISGMFCALAIADAIHIYLDRRY